MGFLSRMNTASEASRAAEIVLNAARKLRSLLSGSSPIVTDP